MTPSNSRRPSPVLVALRWLLTLLMVSIGVLHFTHVEVFASIMPPYLPWHVPLVYLSGAIELGLGVLLAGARTRNFAAWALIALYIAVFPANIHMALNDVTVAGLPEGMSQPTRLQAWIRLPFQFLLMYWAYQYTGRAEATRRRKATKSPS